MMFEKNTILTLVTLIGLVALAMASGGIPAPDAMSTAGILFLVVMIELIVYFLVTMVMNARATIAMAALTAMLFAILRFLCSMFGGFIISLVPDGMEFYSQVTLAWVGNPILILLQIVLLLGAGPFILATYVPELLGREQAALLSGSGTGGTLTIRQDVGHIDANPAGGFIQVFSFEELAGVIKKSQGLEGFVILSNEGLVVYRDLPIRLDVDALVARLYAHNSSIGHMMMESGLTKVRRVMVEARDHYIFITTLNPNFSLVLVFHGRITPEEIMQRVALIAKTTREYLQWKYPSLPLASGITLDRIPLESI